MKTKVFCVAAVALLAASSTASAALITFNTRATFDAQAGVLPIETFEEGNIAAGAVAPCPSPLSSASNNGCFATGDILPGLTLDSSTARPTDGLALAGAGFGGVPSKTVFANFFSDSLNLMFSGSSAVGFDLFSQFSNSTITVSVFGAGDVLLNSFNIAATTGGVFFGVINDAGLITRINLFSLTDQAEGVDNIAFGQQAVPEPASLALLGAGLLGVARARRRARS